VENGYTTLLLPCQSKKKALQAASKSAKNQADADRDVGGRATLGAVAEIKVLRITVK